MNRSTSNGCLTEGLENLTAEVCSSKVAIILKVNSLGWHNLNIPQLIMLENGIEIGHPRSSVWCFNHCGDWLMSVKNLRAISAASFSCEEMLCFSMSVLSTVYAVMAFSSRML
jgi:hypothetical protein